jgi:hypothetical protein
MGEATILIRNVWKIREFLNYMSKNAIIELRDAFRVFLKVFSVASIWEPHPPSAGCLCGAMLEAHSGG